MSDLTLLVVRDPAGSAQATALAHFGQRCESTAEEIGADNALVFNADGTVTAVSESKRHGTGTALVQRRGH
jgi:gamma-glutamyltranspeptidase/glutathione hydrolase